MATFKRFEEIEAWQKARELTRDLYRVSAEGAFGRDFALRDQIRRASVSAMSNIAEGFGRGGNKEFIQFLSMAKGSCSEVVSHLYVALDQEYLSLEQFERLVNLAQETGRLIGGLIVYLKKTSWRGAKFR